ncbi:hypothetical protein DFH06DRAFT_1017361 [Mycena polygramma]|nr:hypothetical protein DFH06DRAFT_1017361 [Mycena polygramma]
MWWGSRARGAVLVDLAQEHHRRYDLHHNKVDLDRCIASLHEAISLLDERNPVYAITLRNLASLLSTRLGLHCVYWGSEHSDSPDNDAAIDLYRQLLRITPISDPNRADYVMWLAQSLRVRFDARDMSTDLNDLIELHRETATCAQEEKLAPLAHALQERYLRTGHSSDLDEAIELFRRIANMLPVHDILLDLGMALLRQFDRWSEMHDIESVIELARDTLENYPDSWQFMTVQANALNRRFKTLKARKKAGNRQDVVDAVQLYRRALELQPSSSPERGNCLTNLAGALHEQFEITGAVLTADADLDLSIQFHEEAVVLCRPLSPDLPSYLNNLAGSLRLRFMKRKDPEDAARHLELMRQAIALIPDRHPEAVLLLRNLGVSLIEQYNGPSNSHILEEAVTALRKASDSASSLAQRFDILWMWGQNIGRLDIDHESALEAYRGAIELLPQLSALNLDVQSRLEVLSQTAGFCTTVVSYAHRVDNPTAAIEFLEASRSVFWTQILRTRVSLDSLRRHAPILADELSEIMRKLEHAAKTASIGAGSRRYRELNDAWTEMVEKVRQVEGFDHFLKPHSFERLKAAASRGPVIVLNSMLGTSVALIKAPTVSVYKQFQTVLTVFVSI